MKYDTPELEIIKFNTADILASSEVDKPAEWEDQNGIFFRISLF